MITSSTKTMIIAVGIAAVFSLSVWPQNTAAPAAGTTSVQKPKKKAKATGIDSVKLSLHIADSLKRIADSIARADSLAAVPKAYSLRVLTDPDSAAVLLDDSLRGVSPCTLNTIAPGGHVLTLRKKGFYLKKAEISVDSASPQELSFVLLKPAFLRVTSDPSGAVLSLDGNREGSTPYENDKIKPGNHSVKLELKQYASVQKTVSCASGGRDSLQVTLEHTQAWGDSVARARKTMEKLHKEKSIFAIVSGIFCLCAIVLVVLEANRQ